MKRAIQVGDRVRIYDVDTGTGEPVSDTGTVRQIMPNGTIHCGMDHWGFTGATVWHPKQCRRLIRRERRRVWLNEYEDDGRWYALAHLTREEADRNSKDRSGGTARRRCTEFVEARPGKAGRG